MSTNAPQTFPPGPPLSQLVKAPTPAPPRIRTDNEDTMVNALRRIKDLEAENKALRSKLETVEEALAGAHRVIRQARDKDSTIAPLDN